MHVSCLGHVDTSQYAGYFDDLAALIRKYPSIAKESKFVFIPGPNDPGSISVVPRPPVSTVYRLPKDIPSTPLHHPLAC